MSQFISGSSLNPQNIISYDINISTLTNFTIVPPYQGLSSGSYHLFIGPNSDTYFQTSDRGNLLTNNFSYATAPQVLIGSSNSQSLFQNKNDFNFYPLATRVSPMTTQVNGLAWNGVFFVAVGSGSNTIAASKDGISWVPRDTGSVILTAGWGVGWNGSLWVVCGNSGNTSNVNTVATSTDTVTWTGIPGFLTSSGAAGNTEPMRKLIYGLSNVIACTNSSVSRNYYSQNAISWSIGTSSFSRGHAVAWNGIMFVMTYGTGGTGISYSYNGINWTTNTTGFQAGTTFGIEWSATLGIWIATNIASGTVNTIHYSYDPRYTWTSTVSLASLGFYDVEWNGTNFVAIGNTATYYSTTGTSWTSGASNPFSTSGNGLAWSPTLSLWVAVGTGTTTIYYTTVSNGSSGWTAATGNLFTTAGYSVAWSPTLNLFVAAGQGTYSIAYSTNGILWVGLISGPDNFTTNGYGITWASPLNLFIATGTGANNFLTSPDGLNWTPRGSTGVDSLGEAVAWSQSLNQWLLVGTGNHCLATSSDGQNWVGRTGTTIFSTAFCVVWNPVLNFWVAGGTGTFEIATSPDGITWTGRGATSSITAGTVYGIAWNGSYYVAVGNAMTVNGTASQIYASSLDGVNWIAQGAAGITGTAYSITWAASLGLWLATGTTTNSYATSTGTGFARTAGMTWTGNGSTTYLTIGYSSVWSPELSLFVTGGTVAGSTGTLVTSPDGTTWTAFNPLNTFFTIVYAVQFNGKIWVAGGQGNSLLASSPDGITWTTRGAGLFSSACFALAWNGGQWVAGGNAGTNTIATSSDGVTWVGRGITAPTTAVYAVTWFPWTSIWIAGGVSTTTPVVGTSSDGITWTSRATTGLTTAVYAVAAYQNLVVIGGGVSTSAFNTSANGLTYVAAGGQTAITTNVFGIAYSPTLALWVAVGAGTNSIATSTNGSTWTGQTGITLFSTAGRSITWNGNMFIATGTGTNVAATSTNGTTWLGTSATTGYNSWNALGIRQVTTVAGGSGTNTLAYSFDGGLSWYPNGIGLFTTAVYMIAWNGNYWVAVGQGGSFTIATAPDGITWTGQSAIFSTAGYGVVWCNSISLWIAVGAGTNAIATSPNGSTWTQRTALLLFTTGAYAVAWNGTVALAIGAGAGSTVAISTNGIGWTGTATTIAAPTLYSQIAWNGSFWVAGTDNSQLFSSPDGITWTNRLAVNYFRGVAWNGYRFMAALSTGAIYTSLDGITWTAQTSLPTLTTTGATRVSWNSVSLLWMVTAGDTGTYHGNILSAPDSYPLVWSYEMSYPVQVQMNAFIFVSTLNTVVSSPGYNWVAGGASGLNSVRSVDGYNWISIGNSPTYLGATYGIAWNGTIFVAVGGGTQQIMTSSDGNSWTGYTNGGLSWTTVYAVIWVSSFSRWVACGSTGSAGIIGYSTNGSTWVASTLTSLSGSTGFYAVAWNSLGSTGSPASAALVVVGTGTAATCFALSSGNGGTAFTASTFAGSANTNSAMTTAGRGVVWASNLSLWVAVGNGTNCIATSADGNSWTGYTTTTIFGTQGNAIAYNNSILVAVGTGTNTIAWSSNGTTWNGLGTTILPSAATAIYWNSSAASYPLQPAWIAGGTNTYYFATSADGINWVSRNAFTSTVYAVVAQNREKTFQINNTQWTGRTSQQTFRILG